MERSWSVSALHTISSCGRKYKFKYVDHQIEEEEKTSALAFGSAIHKCIERLHKEGDKWDNWDGMWGMWGVEWREHCKGLDWKAQRPPYKAFYDKLGPTILKRYVEDHRDADILELEYVFPSNYDHMIGRFKIKGMVDQVRRLPNGRLLLVDLKTSTKEIDPLMLRGDVQLTMYWKVIREKYNEDPLLAILHLRTGEMLYTERNESDLAIVEEMLEEAQHKVDNKMFARNIDWTCRYCPFMEQCLGPIGG